MSLRGGGEKKGKCVSSTLMKKHQQLSQVLGESGKETIAALDEMEEKLQRLGICQNASDAVGNSMQTRSTQEYLASIKKAKNEASELRHEKEYRQFASEEQKHMNTLMVSGVNKEQALSNVIQKALCLLDRETQLAEKVESKRVHKVAEETFRATELQRKKLLHSRVHRLMKDTSAVTFAGHLTASIESEENMAAKRLLKANAAREYCHTIAAGLVEVAMRVTDNMYNFSCEGETPVKRSPQDLSVTQWRAWVEEFVFPKTTSRWMSDILAVTSLRELRNPDYKFPTAHKNELLPSVGDGEGSDISVVGTVNMTCNIDSASDTSVAATATAKAEKIIKRVTALQRQYTNNRISRTVADATQLIKNQEKGEFRILLDDVRRQNDTQCVEEAVPGWSHRLPPAGCFVYGDDLSGLKAIADAALADSAQEVLQTQLKQRFSAPLSEPIKSPTESEALKSDDASCRILLPSMLIRAPQTASGQGSGGGGYSAASTKLHKGGGGASVSGSARVKEGKQVEDATESKQYIDTLCDLLVREILAVHQYNLQSVMRSNSVCSEMGPAATRGLRTLFLVSFPETEYFWRTLHQKLHIAVEAMEQEMNWTLRNEEASDEIQQPPSSKNGRMSQRSRVSLDAGVSRGKASKLGVAPSRKKGVVQSPLLGNEDDCAPPRSRVYPPLCLLGIFLHYDVPSRYRRMRAANFCPLSNPNEQKHPKLGTASSDGEWGDSVAEWSVQKLRSELVKQEFKMRGMWKRWRANVCKSFVPPEPEAEKTSVNDKHKKRVRNSVLRKTSVCMPAAPVASQTPLPRQFPNVLFFFHKEDITSLSEVDNHAELLINNLKFVLNPTIRSATRNETLLPGQLVAPLRLGDYRLPSVVLLQLVELHQRFHTHWNEKRSTSVAATLPSPEKELEEEEMEKVQENTVIVETEVHRVFQTFSSNLLFFITNNVFPPSLWTGQCTSGILDQNTTDTRGGLNRTMHFFSIDGNYDRSREELHTLFVNGISKLTATCALLLRCALDVALESVGEALGQLCAWLSTHFTFSKGLCMDVDKTESLMGSVSIMGTNTKEALPTADRIFVCKSTKARFLVLVPRLSFEEVLAMVEQLDGRDESFGKFQRDLWSYASRVHQTTLDGLCNFVQTTGGDLNMEMCKGWEALAPYVTQVILACTLAFSPPESQSPELYEKTDMKCEVEKEKETVVAATEEGEGEKDGNELKCHTADGIGTMCWNSLPACLSPTISVTIGRVVAAIRVLRRCSIIMGLCAARWVDSMYATALTISPQGNFPPESRPADIAAIFSPPHLVAHQGDASPPTLALQLLSGVAPALKFVPEDERDCWWETEMEVVLQNFSMYQKQLLDEGEFLHCVFQTQLSNIWRFLPIGVYEVAKRLNVSLPPSLSLSRNGEEEEMETLTTTGVTNVCITLPWLTKKDCRSIANPPSVAMDGEEEVARMFRVATESQQRGMLGDASTSGATVEVRATCPSTGVVGMQRGRKSLLYLREYFISATLQRLQPENCSEDIVCKSHAATVHKPSIMELREMVRSLPRAVREQGPDEIPQAKSVSMEEWKSIKWWCFFDSPSLEKQATFIRRYLLRILTVCFQFANGDLCARLVPFLPDVLSVVVRTHGPQAMMERYYHALAALNASRDKKLLHSQQENVTDGPMMAFDLSLTVAEALFFFQRAGEVVLRGPCVGAPCYEPHHHGQLGSCASTTEGGTSVDEDCDDNSLLTLEAELTLLLEVEKQEALSLSLLGSSHWGQHVTPRLMAIPPETGLVVPPVRRWQKDVLFGEIT